MGSFIKLDRKMLENKYFKYPYKAQQLRVWLYLLMNAAYETKENDEIKRYGHSHLKPGQLIRSRDTIARDLRLQSNQVKVALNSLRRDNMITTKGSNKNTLITIVNWEIYQGGKKQSDQQNNQQSDQQKDNKVTNKKTTKSPQTKNIYPTDIKEEKKEKNIPDPPEGGPDPDPWAWGGPKPSRWNEDDEWSWQNDQSNPNNPRMTRMEIWKFWGESDE